MPNDATSLAYPAGSAFTVSGQRIKPTASATATRLLASSFNLASGSGSYYLSFLAKKDATGALRIEANNASAQIRWGVKVNADGSIAVQGGGTAYGTASAAGVFANATTYLVVARFVTGATADGKVKMFKDGDPIPTSDSGLVWDATAGATTGVSQDRFQIVPTAGTVEVDEFRFGTTWGDVVGTGGVATITFKANNANNLNLGSSWIGGVPPTPSLAAVWDSTVTGANTTSLGADATWSGINIQNPGGLVTINAGNTLTLGAAATDIDLSSATADLTLNCALALGAANVWNIATNRTLTVGGVVSGAFPVTKSGNGTAVLSGANTYNGTTTLSAGFLSVSATNNLGAPTAGLLLDGGTLRITGSTMTNMGHTLSYTAGKDVTLEISDAGNTFIVDQALTQGAGRFIKQGVGTATLTGADTYTGNLIARQGTLNLWGAKTGAMGNIVVSDTAGLNATLNLTNGLYAITVGTEFSVGNAPTTAATGIVNQSGGQVTFGASGNQMLIGRQANIGNTGNYNLSGGSITIPLSSLANRGVMLGVNQGASANFTLSGTGALNMTTASGGSGDASLLLGRADSAADNTTNTFSQSGGTASVGRLSIGGNGATSVGVRSTLTLTGGTFSANQFDRLAAGDGNIATITIGGTAQVTLPAFPTARGSGATTTLNFDGGTLSPLAASTSYLSNLTTAYIKAGGATFNVGSGNDITIAQPLLTDPVSMGGGLIKTGLGTLTLASNNTYTGSTVISNGSLALYGNVPGLVSVNAGASLWLNDGVRENSVVVSSTGAMNFSGASTVTNLACFNNAVLNFNVDSTNTVGNLTVIAASGVTNSGSITINLTGAVPVEGVYTLINYTGSLQGSGFGAYQLGAAPPGRSYTLSNAPGAVQLVVGPPPNFVQVETKADGTGVAVPDTTILTGTSLTNFAILRTGGGVFITNVSATWVLTNVTGAVASSNLVAVSGGKSAVFKPVGVGSARILAQVSGTNAVPSGTITSINLTTRPFIWVRDSDKAAILAKIATNAWATNLFNGMVARVAPDLSSYQSNRDSYLRGLPINWAAAPPVLNPTTTTYDAGENYFNTALDCAVLFYLTGKTNYARCAADILHNSISAFQNLAPSTSVGNGGWLIQDDLLYEARQVGGQLPLVYDFLYQYLQANQVYDVDQAGLVNFSFTNAQYVFRTYYQLVRDHGQLDSNWSSLMSPCMLNNLLALDSISERTNALNVYLYTGSSRQDSFDYDYNNYAQPGDIWPEALQYSSDVGQIRSTHMVLLERYDPTLNLFGVYSNLPISLPRISYLRYPNTSMQINFGDGFRDAEPVPYFRYELMYQHALARGRTNLTALFGPLINGGVASGAYSRSTLSDYARLGQHDEPLALLWQAPVISEPGVNPTLPRTDTLPYAGISLQRNPTTVSNSTFGMMCFVGGAAHVHSHASGMSMELFGLGQVMGAKPGHSTYGTPIHENYYRLFSANNTIVVNAASQGSGGWSGLGINTVQNLAMEPKPFAAAVSSNFSFTCSSFADNMGAIAEATQQRTLSIVRTSPTSGFYVDFFRSKSTVTSRVATTLNGNVTNQFHDYIYHNIGSTNISLTTNGATLPLIAQPSRFQNDIGDGYEQPGWRYFTNTVVSYPHGELTRVLFNAAPSGTILYMDMLVAAVTNREYARASSPPIVDYNTADSPAVVIRQIGEAWDKPFAVVYEPHYAATRTVTNVTALWRANTVVGLKVESVVGGIGCVHYVLSNTNATDTYTNSSLGLSFTGRFGIVADNGNGSVTLYLGEGKSLSYRGNSVSVVGNTNSQAEAQFISGQPPVVSANSPVNVVSAVAPVFTQINRLVNGVVEFSATGALGVPYRLWGATNLTAGGWTLLASGTVTNNTIVLQDSTATNLQTRYYRFSTP